MNATKILLSAVIAISYFFLTSCIQPEALNTEADIESCQIEGDVLISPPKIENNRVTLMLSPKADITRLALDFVLTPGATIVPASGTVLDYRQPQSFIVTSEDGQWNKTYTISCMVDKMGTTFGFEHYRTAVDKNGVELYHEFYEVAVENEKLVEQNIWASGNTGFKIVASGKTPEDYPTVSSPDGMVGRCLKLETRSTGKVGEVLKMPLAAGNLFIGSYSGSLNALTATHFGIPFSRAVPIALCGYYKYKAGAVYTDKQLVEHPDKKDNFDIYCIMYETDDKVKYLDGNTALTSPNLVAMARMPEADKKETDEWNYFYLPIEVLPGKTIDPAKLADNKYNLSIVFSSSIEGAKFTGAVGSTLYIDQVELLEEE
ncbi:PCMD domain-containing protein [Parabacteroides sp. OttesenSCG-928-B22]|nr:PCMD domain-containing protein [Parabacteroides sp. OttesenSCG-928-B22]